ncbi:MAG: TonB-dependent receptor [Gammaproteobacteria bacterium]|nr:TonB-dependent receptor [Gammaproteobacteria bacterium]
MKYYYQADVGKLFLIIFITSLLSPTLINAAILEEVVVTAQKREQNLQDVGISVSAFTGEQLRSLGYTNAQQVTSLAAGVSTVQPNGEANYSLAIRGAASSDFTSNNESPVAIYVDDVYISQMSGTGFMLFDMERVEILRGPQGTLYGRNATGGLAHFITRKPTQEFNGYGQLTVGEYDQIKFEGAVGGGLSDTLSGRFSLSTHHNSGYIENRLDPSNDLNNANDYAGRIQLLFEPNEDLSFLLNGRYSLQEIRTGFFENASAFTTGQRTPGTPIPFLGGYVDTDGDVYAGDYNDPGYNDNETYGITGTLDWNLGNLAITSITDFSSVKRDYIEDSDASPVTTFNFLLTTDAEQFSQEIRLSGETDKAKWVTGFYYLDIDVSDSNGGETTFYGDLFACLFGAVDCDPNTLTLNTPFPGAFGVGEPPIFALDQATGNFLFDSYNGGFRGLKNPYTIDTTSWSLFGQIEYTLNDQWSVIGGFRWIEEDKDYAWSNNWADFRGGNANILATLQAFSTSSSDSLWSAKAQVDYRPNDDLLLFASWNHGVKASGFNAPFVGVSSPPADILPYKPEELDAFEVGFKATLLDGRARLNASGYYYDYEDYQAFNLVIFDALTSNLPAEMHGFEAEIQATPVDNLDLLLGVAYNDAEISLGGGATSRPVQSPKWNISGLVRYQWPMMNGNMAIQGDFDYRSGTIFNLSDNPNTGSIGGYTVVNTRLSYTTADEKWDVAVFANNIFDREYRVQQFDITGDPLFFADGFLGLVEEYYGRPRWIGGSISYNF